MAFWSGQTILRRVKAEALIDDFDEHAIACSAYELCVGSEAFVTRDKADQAEEISQGRTPGHIVAKHGATICIPSGQFAFLLTKENVRIPSDAIGLISMKASKKWQGLVNVSGFHVDPGWKGQLLFGVFNAGPQTQIIRPGEKLFLLFFSSLDETADKDFIYKGDNDFSNIPTKLMQPMSISVPTVYKLNDNVRELREEAKGAQNRSLVSLTLSIAAVSLALAAISIGLAVFKSSTDRTSTTVATTVASSAAGSPATVVPSIASPNNGLPLHSNAEKQQVHEVDNQPSAAISAHGTTDSESKEKKKAP